MKKLIDQLCKWNKAYEDVASNMIRLSFYDDESGHLEYDDFSGGYNDRVVKLANFISLSEFLLIDPYQYRKDNSLGN